MSNPIKTVQLVVVPNPFAIGQRKISHIGAGRLADLIPETLAGRDDVVAYYEGERVEPSDWGATHCDGGTLGLVVVPGWYNIGLFFQYLFVAYVVSSVSRGILSVARKPAQRHDRSSSVYSFDGISNTRSEGLPISLVFGEMRFGGNVVSEFVRTLGIPSRSILFQQLSLGEGPIHSISGETNTDTQVLSVPPSIKVDSNSADNLDEVELWIRLGTNEQSVVPGFEVARRQIWVNLEMTSPIDTSDLGGDVPATGYSLDDWEDNTNELYWDEFGVAVDLGAVKADAAIAQLTFQRGLFEQDASTGELLPAYYAYQTRFQELDSAGNPITTGGVSGDGWIRQQPVGPFAAESSEAFTLEAPIQFTDPTTVGGASTPGKALSTYATATTVKELTSYTVSFWFKAAALPSSGSHNLVRFGAHVSATPQPGLRAVLLPGGGVRVTVKATLPSPYGDWYEFFDTPDGSVTPGAWHHLAIVTDVTVIGIVQTYIDGTLRGQVLSPGTWLTYSPNIQVGVTHRIGDDPTLVAGYDIAFDQFVIYDGSSSASLISQEYNFGVGRTDYFPFVGPESAVRFDDTAGAQDPDAPDTQTFSAWTPVVAAGATSGVVDGIVQEPQAGVNIPKRARYRVEVVRFNFDQIDTRITDGVHLTGIIAVTNAELTYPNTPLLAIRAGATEQLSGTAPTTTAIVKGLLVPVWDGASTANPSISTEWSANPAWVALGLLTNRRWGMGHTYLIQDCVSQSLLDWANYCDNIVYSGSQQFNYATPTTTEEDVLFVKDTADPLDRGTITFSIRADSAGASLPSDWVAGTYLRAHGFPVSGSGADINSGIIDTSDTGGYEVTSVVLVPSTNDYWQISCHWDRLDETDPWASGTYLSAHETLTTASTLELGEHRHEFNGVFDQEQGAWDSILEVCQVGRATPIREGSKVRFKFQAARDPVGLVCSANIAAETFSVTYTDGQMKANAIDATIADKAQDYDLVPITILDSAIANITHLDEVRKESRTYFGITSAAQAERQARLELNMNRLIKRSGQFTLGPSGLPFEAGDLVRLGADIMPRGDGGRALRASHPGTGYKLEMIADPLDFTAWTASNVTVTANTVPNPYGTTDADKVQDSGSVHGYVEATGTVSGSDLNAEWLSFGVYIKPGVISSDKTLVALILGGGTASYFCDWETETIYASQFATLPEDMRSAHIQKLGTSGWYFAQVAGFHETQTSTAAAPIVRVFPASNTSGAGAATGIVELFSGRLSYGQWAAPGGPLISDRVVMIDRDLTLADGAHKVYGRDFVDNAAEGPLDAILCPAGAYTTGDLLITSAQSTGSTSSTGVPDNQVTNLLYPEEVFPVGSGAPASGMWVDIHGTANENERVVKTTPYNTQGVVWEAINQSTANTSAGGCDGQRFDIDATKTYRFTMWIRKQFADADDGNVFFGTHGWNAANGTALKHLSGSLFSNAYFAGYFITEPPSSGTGIDDWYLWVGYVNKHDYVGIASNPERGFWGRDGSQTVGPFVDYKWASDATESHVRFYHHYNENPPLGQTVDFFAPRVDIVDGSEPTITELLGGAGFTTAGMATALQEESSWLVVKSGDELVVEIVSSSLGQDLTRECEWVEYNAAIYDDVAGVTSTSALLGFTDDGYDQTPISSAISDNSLPGRTTITGTTDVLTRTAPGQYTSTVYIGLAYDPTTQHLISRTDIFWQILGPGVSDWALAGGVTGLNTSAVLRLPNAQPGQTIELTANSITQRGRRRRPGSSLRVQVPLRGLTAPPETPTSVSAKLSQRQAVYGYTVSGEDLLAVEVRRGGGWILGQLVSRDAASQRAGSRFSEPTSNWAGSTTGSPTLRYAAQNTTGAYGVPATLTFNPTPDADRLPSDATGPDQAWESWAPFGNGWENTVPASGEPFIGPEFEQAADGSLGFTAASTSVAWETVYTSQRDSGAALTLEQDRQPRAAFLEAWVDADAVNPTTWDGGTWGVGDMLYDRWTWEGPRYTTPGETANPELVIEVRINIDGTTAGWGSWQEYKPGIYRIVDAQFRLRARRHDTGQNIIVAKLHTRITPPRLSLEETTPVQSMLHGESF